MKNDKEIEKMKKTIFALRLTNIFIYSILILYWGYAAIDDVVMHSRWFRGLIALLIMILLIKLKSDSNA